MKNAMHITLTDVRKRFAEHVVLDGISLTIHCGETVAIIGPSGGGKSTLLRCLNGLNTFDAGEIRIGTQILKPSLVVGTNGTPARAVRRLLGMVFQDFQLFPHLTA